jgi:phospholipid transport system substrate-binding protein
MITAAGTACVVAFTPISASALSAAQAQTLVDSVVAEINRVIDSGASEAAMIRDFEGIFDRYADVPAIARYALGADARSASSAQMTRFTAAFRSYITRKYGRRFREFIGGQIVVQNARAIQDNYEVQTTAVLRGQPPFRVDFRVSDKSGRVAFYNIIIEGIDMLLSERTEIGAMLDRRGGDLNRLVSDLANA